MPLYFYETKLSENGLVNIKNIPAALDEAVKLLESIGGKVVGVYSIFGENSFLTILEFPDDETAETWNLFPPGESIQPLLDIETIYKGKRIFSLDEFKEIVKKLP